MIHPALEAEILRLFHAENWPIGTIAAQLGIHHSVVRRVLAGDGGTSARRRRPRMIDPFLPFIFETLEKYPRISASRLHAMVKERGYRGQPGHFRALLAGLRPLRLREAYLRLRTLPAEEAQVDWAHFGRVQVGRASRPLSAFVMVLSWSRAIFLHFFYSQSLSSFFYGHRFAFEWFGGVPRKVLYDNLKAVVIERVGRAIRFNRQFLQLAGHYRIEPRPVAVARGNEKGRVERSIRFVRSSFFAARRFRDLDDLNRQALLWCQGESLERRWPEDTRKTVGEIFSQEKEKLLALPQDPFPCHERTEVRVGKTPYVRFDLNDYSIPHRLVRRTLTVLATLHQVRIVDGQTVIATHRRSWGRHERIEDPRHVEALAQEKSAAGRGRRTERLLEILPASTQFLEAMAARNQPLGRATSELLELVRTYGTTAVTAAIEEALRRDTPHTQALRHILDRDDRAGAGGVSRLPVHLPEDHRVRDLHVRHHDLESYDSLLDQHQPKEDDDDDDDYTCASLCTRS